MADVALAIRQRIELTCPYEMSITDSGLAIKLSPLTMAYKELSDGAYLRVHKQPKVLDDRHVRLISRHKLDEQPDDTKLFFEGVPYRKLEVDPRTGYATVTFPPSYGSGEVRGLMGDTFKMMLADVSAVSTSPGVWLFQLPLTGV